jgi:hypothetical protein
VQGLESYNIFANPKYQGMFNIESGQMDTQRREKRREGRKRAEGEPSSFWSSLRGGLQDAENQKGLDLKECIFVISPFRGESDRANRARRTGSCYLQAECY